MRHTILLLCAAATHVAAQTGGWQTLFNGKDLTGWRANVDPESFKVQNGAIRAQASGKVRSHLFFVGDRQQGFEEFKNFELEAIVRAEPDSNSGIFVHTDMTERDAARHLAKGYEVQLNSSEKEKRKTGSLYDVVDLDKSPVDEAHWFTLRIIVIDKTITVALDDQKVIDYTEPPDVKRPRERSGRLFSANGGAIALQAHDPKSVWYFREIRIKRLSSAP